MIVWGGHDANLNPLNTGARYNPATDTWTAISTTNAPAARANHTAIWTGREMIVWGGSVNAISGFFSDGAKYNPATDTWTTISNVNAPVARMFHSAIWTGTEMIVWGGQNNTGIQTSGGRYNPSTDTWTPVNTANAPAARGSNSVVWTGSEMVIWGGAGIGLLNTGGRYSPLTDSWTATSTTHAPTARAGHTAVWTGSEMIVWGGAAASALSTGGRYNPSTDSWSNLIAPNPPSPRTVHTAVWTGNQMMVWGGRTSTIPDLIVGGRFITAANSWIPTCDTNAPAPRVSHTAVWTGREMIVWGGEDANTNRINTGGRYSLTANVIDFPGFFVRQHYLDFLNREPDQSGLDFWIQQITSCGNDAQCVEAKRINVSAAFFLSIEFQQTGNLVYKMYKASFGNLPGKPVAADRAPFLADTRQIQSTPAQVVVGQGDWQTQLENNKQAFALAFVQRAQFQMIYADIDAGIYVQMLFNKAGVTPTAAETAAAINAFNNAGGGDAGRAAGLRSVAESNSVSTKLFNEAFVLMQYFGYLQRNPYDPPEPTLDYFGFNFWLNKLNQFNGDYLAAEMVKAFISSDEYRHRFGP
jgi:N-acetylneuraminic acid mutarotase